NHVHIKDVADCFIYCIEHAKKMIGRPYNVGSNEANLSKEELALKIKQFIPNFYIHFSEVGSDPDKRNYIVSNKRLMEAGFRAKRSIEEGIQELIKGYQMIKHLPYKNI
ncbi:MAG: NAD(P)-dependent oxidoreductase, partial [Patescibacteria group bacterium]